MNLEDIVKLIFNTGVSIYQSANITFGDYTINLFIWIVGFAAIILVAEIIGRILQ